MVKQADVRELAGISLFERLKPEELAQLQALARRKTYRAGTAVFFQDDPSDSMYVVLSGSAKVYQTSEDGQPRILKILEPGEVVGELAMIEGQPRSASVETLEESELLSLSRTGGRLVFHVRYQEPEDRIDVTELLGALDEVGLPPYTLKAVTAAERTAAPEAPATPAGR